MTKLNVLHARLKQLRRRRAALRWGLAFGALCVAVLWVLAGAFLFDWLLLMSRPQRLVLLLLCCGIVVWVFLRRTRPQLKVRESELEMALAVEKQQGIDSDLVAAIQFDRPSAEHYASPQLAVAVVDYVAHLSPSLPVFEGFSYKHLGRLGAILLATMLAQGALVAMFPGHARAFFDRLLLGTAQYPTRTRIERVVVNGRRVLPAEQSATHASPYDRRLAFRVAASGELPAAGRIVLRGLKHGGETELTLEPAASHDRNGNKLQEFQAELPRLVDAVEYRVFLGDAWTDPLEVSVIPLPVVEIELEVTPPAYAAASASSLPPPGARQLSVVEGSRIDLALTCTNKALAHAELAIDERTWPLSPSGGSGRRWSLAGDSPLASVSRSLRYEVQVRDTDGLRLERPLQGYLRLKSDRPPRVTAALVSTLVLPEAQPQITFAASDDYGLTRVAALVQVLAADGGIREYTEPMWTVPSEKQPATVARGEFALELAKFDLEKGDEIKLMVEAQDFRGDAEPETSVSEPQYLQVTDRKGILAGLLESDEESAETLESIIQRELGIGDAK